MKTCQGPVQVSNTGWLTKGSLPEAEKEGKDGGTPRRCLEAEAWRPGQELWVLLECKRRHKKGSGRAALGRTNVISLNLIYRKQGWRLLEGQASICPKVRLGVPRGLTPSKKRWKGGT